MNAGRSVVMSEPPPPEPVRPPIPPELPRSPEPPDIPITPFPEPPSDSPDLSAEAV